MFSLAVDDCACLLNDPSNSAGAVLCIWLQALKGTPASIACTRPKPIHGRNNFCRASSSHLSCSI